MYIQSTASQFLPLRIPQIIIILYKSTPLKDLVEKHSRDDPNSESEYVNIPALPQPTASDSTMGSNPPEDKTAWMQKKTERVIMTLCDV